MRGVASVASLLPYNLQKILYFLSVSELKLGVMVKGNSNVLAKFDELFGSNSMPSVAVE